MFPYGIIPYIRNDYISVSVHAVFCSPFATVLYFQTISEKFFKSSQFSPLASYARSSPAHLLRNNNFQKQERTVMEKSIKRQSSVASEARTSRLSARVRISTNIYARCTLHAAHRIMRDRSPQNALSAVRLAHAFSAVTFEPFCRSTAILSPRAIGQVVRAISIFAVLKGGGGDRSRRAIGHA